MNNDWIIWNGGACQVSPDTIVQPQFRDQSRHDAEKNREVSARDTFWAHTGSDNDVIAYRVVSEPLWAEITGYSDDYGSTRFVGFTGVRHPNDTHRIRIPMKLIDGKRVIDDSRQPVMEKL